MVYLYFLIVFVFKEEVPAKWGFHIVNKISFLVRHFIFFIFFLCSIFLGTATSMQIVGNNFLYVCKLLSFEALQKNVVLYILEYVRVDLSEFLSRCQPLFFLLIVKILLPYPESLKIVNIVLYLLHIS